MPFKRVPNANLMSSQEFEGQLAWWHWAVASAAVSAATYLILYRREIYDNISSLPWFPSPRHHSLCLGLDGAFHRHMVAFPKLFTRSSKSYYQLICNMAPRLMDPGGLSAPEDVDLGRNLDAVWHLRYRRVVHRGMDASR